MRTSIRTKLKLFTFFLIISGQVIAIAGTWYALSGAIDPLPKQAPIAAALVIGLLLSFAGARVLYRATTKPIISA